jgi:hypothetical protein
LFNVRNKIANRLECRRQPRLVLRSLGQKCERIPRVVGRSWREIGEIGASQSRHETENILGRSASSVQQNDDEPALAESGTRLTDGLSAMRVHGERCGHHDRASPDSISRRAGSSHGGSFSTRPSSSTGSSIVNPGPIVAISKSTPPGSRK